MARIRIARDDAAPLHTLRITDRRHKPIRLKRDHIRGATLVTTIQVHDDADWIELDMEETIHYGGGRSKTRLIGTSLMADEACALWRLLADRYGGDGAQ